MFGMFDIPEWLAPLHWELCNTNTAYWPTLATHMKTLHYCPAQTVTNCVILEFFKPADLKLLGFV